MNDEVCEFCGRDPYHWVDIGVGYERVAIVCCDEAIEAYHRDRDATAAAAPCEDMAVPKDLQARPEGIAQPSPPQSEK